MAGESVVLIMQLENNASIKRASPYLEPRRERLGFLLKISCTCAAEGVCELQDRQEDCVLSISLQDIASRVHSSGGHKAEHA